MFKDEFKKLRLEWKYTQEEIAQKLGVGKSTISMYENGNREPDFEMLEAIADVFNVDMNRLISAKQPSPAPHYPPNIYKVELKKFPLLGKIACGEPIWADEDRESYVMADCDIKADFCLKAQGESMINARILDGDIVFIKEQPMVENGEIAAVIIDDEATLKRVYYEKNKNKIMLVAENSAFPPMVYIGEELEHIRILGKAVYFTSMVI